MGKENSDGRTVVNMKASGRVENSMVSAFIETGKVKRRKASGSTVGEFSGYLESIIVTSNV